MAHRHEIREEDLEGRSRDVLREIVIQYVANGEPISSRSLAKSGRFALSPASLRNVMADLEDLGYVYQPHTSAGRIPTDRGYRFFIKQPDAARGSSRSMNGKRSTRKCPRVTSSMR
jgi:transcriptional regulator of heat shock response